MIPWETKLHAIQQSQEKGSTTWLKKQRKRRLGSAFDEAQRTLQYASSTSQSNYASLYLSPKYRSIIPITRCPYTSHGIKPKVEPIKTWLFCETKECSKFNFSHVLLSNNCNRNKKETKLSKLPLGYTMSAVSQEDPARVYDAKQEITQCSHALTELLSTLRL